MEQMRDSLEADSDSLSDLQTEVAIAEADATTANSDYIKDLKNQVEAGKKTMLDRVVEAFKFWGKDVPDNETITAEGVTSENPTGANKIVRDRVDATLRDADAERQKIGDDSFAKKYGKFALALVLLAGAAGLTIAALKTLADSLTGCYYVSADKSTLLTCDKTVTQQTCVCASYDPTIKNACLPSMGPCTSDGRYNWVAYTWESVLGRSVSTLMGFLKVPSLSSVKQILVYVLILAVVALVLYAIYVYIRRKNGASGGTE